MIVCFFHLIEKYSHFMYEILILNLFLIGNTLNSVCHFNQTYLHYKTAQLCFCCFKV